MMNIKTRVIVLHEDSEDVRIEKGKKHVLVLDAK